MRSPEGHGSSTGEGRREPSSFCAAARRMRWTPTAVPPRYRRAPGRAAGDMRVADSPLGPRRPRNTTAGGLQAGRGREVGRSADRIGFDHQSTASSAPVGGDQRP